MRFHFTEEHQFPAVVRDLLIAAKTSVVELCANQRDDAVLSEHFYKDLVATYRLLSHGTLSKNFVYNGNGVPHGDYVYRAVFAGAIEGAACMYAWEAAFTKEKDKDLSVRREMGPLFYEENGEQSEHLGPLFSRLALPVFPGDPVVAEMTALSIAFMATQSVRNLAKCNIEPRRSLVVLHNRAWHEAMWEKTYDG